MCHHQRRYTALIHSSPTILHEHSTCFTNHIKHVLDSYCLMGSSVCVSYGLSLSASWCVDSQVMQCSVTPQTILKPWYHPHSHALQSLSIVYPTHSWHQRQSSPFPCRRLSMLSHTPGGATGRSGPLRRWFCRSLQRSPPCHLDHAKRYMEIHVQLMNNLLTFHQRIS